MKERIKKYFKEFFNILKRKEMQILPANLAYFFVLAIVPIITIIFLIASSFNLPVNVISDFIEINFSSEILNSLTPTFTNTQIDIQYIIFIIAILMIASNGAHSIIIASNTVFSIPNSGFIKRRLKAFVIIFLLIFLFSFLLLVPLFGETIINGLISLGIDNGVTQFLQKLSPIIIYPVSVIVIFFFIKLVYTIAPDDKIPGKYVNKGAIFTTVTWFVITQGYSYYLNHFAAFKTYYAGLSSLVVIMLYLYLLSFVFVLGLVMNHRRVEREIERTNQLKLKELEDKVTKDRLKETKEIDLDQISKVQTKED